MPIPFHFLQSGTNSIAIEAADYNDGNWDDFEFGEVEIRFQ